MGQASEAITRDEAKRVRALVKRLGLVETSRVLQLHHTSVSRIAAGQAVLRNTATLARLRLAALAESEAA